MDTQDTGLIDVDSIDVDNAELEGAELGSAEHSMLTARTSELFEQLDLDTIAEVRGLRDEFARFLMRYKFGMDEVVTKLNILREEFSESDGYNPIENISCRLKSVDGVLEKANRKGIEPSFDGIRSNLNDIAGVRVTCSFVSDVYRIMGLLTSQQDIEVVEVKDYIANPKPNGYRSLHVILEVPVFLSAGPVAVRVEVQFRTIAMDFWASLEHKTYYKYEAQVPQHLLDGLTDAAEKAADLDTTMERLHREVHGHPRTPATIDI